MTKVLITRPKIQGEALADFLKQHGIDSYCFPTIEIKPTANPEALKALLAKLDQFDIAIFTSRNAVAAVGKAWRGENVKVIAIGPATRDELIHRGIQVDVTPQRFSSEGLLALPELQHLAQKKIIIVGGENPRQLLPNELTRRGADVTFAYVYQRAAPEINVSDYLNEITACDVIVSTSLESLLNLYMLVFPHAGSWLLSTRLIVVSTKMAQCAEKLEWQGSIVQAANPTPDEILKALKH